ncbi:ATP-binding cassette domain-containing protein [Clostridium tagluense]|uniref:ATP-binding cassette domain-containing protein n=1 Tax=Clostridium tagluense TaxID=360422 RepID=UPI001CF223CB|nr:ATP-binding cassette domain-containing protein [Clostridium tagluense]MCB2312581.1 ATP-binding cassette domain-containing protein [Clostridium tagluense]MCB2317257.1 ATP-binding cassette domain-containing protein [Clostridium tagluense]MCB2322122.1 ATP-binding cassette domain-containing protein [Clostridium tagluense]MCB2327053.1 ATP-binding cassette domain-containing protein [Clostridium tagluense]MCB2331771.1 ATP-binding cassette domain-containing protein [Clostridium tagluense]
MSEYIIRASNITKTYGNHKVLDDLSINIKKGDIYGAIGKNGAGKTTIIRVLAGLVIPNNGQVELFGHSEENEITKERNRIGTLIESPALYLNMTAEENLKLVKIQRGIPGNKCIDQTLNLVGLKDVEKKKTKNFSLGMKQRLGIAMALLSEPEFLVLDEPMNGLDPIGIKEIRELLLKLNKERGTTILISSHMLSELTHISNRYGFINDGKLIEEMTANELLNKCRTYLHLKVNDSSDVSVILENEIGIKDFEIFPNNIIRIYDEFDGEKVTTALSKHNIGVKEIMQMGESLEDYFTKLVGGKGNE